MTYSQACIDLVKRFEGLRLVAYRCPADVWTIGWGHTGAVRPGDEINEAMAEHYLTQDLDYTANTLASILPTTVALTQGEFDAVTSLGFNVAGGPRALPHMAPRFWAHLLAGNKVGASQEMLSIDHALVGGKLTELPGLKARRIAEAQMFLD